MSEVAYKKYQQIIRNRKLKGMELGNDGVYFHQKKIVDYEKFDAKTLLEAYGINYDYCLETLLQQMLNTPFPYPHESIVSAKRGYEELIKRNWPIGYSCGIADETIRYFYSTAIYNSHIKNHRSPFEAWNDPELLLRSIENRIIYSSWLEPKHIMNGFSIAKIAPKVSVFSPSFAKSILGNLTDENDSIIFDPFSGFGGRMIATTSLGKRYIGWDVNDNQVECSLNAIRELKLNAQVEKKNALENKIEADVLFTCPPYSSKENWGQEIENKTCDEWIDVCLSNFNCKKYIFVVDSTDKYKNNVVEQYENKSHLSTNYEYILCMNRGEI